MNEEHYGPVVRTTVAFSLGVGDRQLQFVFVRLDDLGLLVGDEAAQLLHSHFDRHSRDERSFDQRAAPQRLEWPPAALYLFFHHSISQLNNLIASLVFSLKQRTVSATQHGFRSVARLQFGDAETCGERCVAKTAVLHRGERLADSLSFTSRGRIRAIGTKDRELF